MIYKCYKKHMEQEVPIDEAMLGDEFVSLVPRQFAVEPRLSYVDCYIKGKRSVKSMKKKERSENRRLTYIG